MTEREHLVDVVGSGSYRESLEALRDRLASECDAAEGVALASLAKQLADVLARIDGLPRVKGSYVDDLARRRADRLPGASVSQLAEGEPVGGRRGNRTRG